MKIIGFIVVCFFIVCGAVSSAYSQETIKSFNIESYIKWNDSTSYHKTYIVNQSHKKASDSNSGTEEFPLLTINAAAKLAKAGERILIHGGTYREMIHPENGGSSPSNMILYEGVAGENIIVKGSRIFKGDWIQKQVLTDILENEASEYAWSRKIWMTKISDSFFENDYFPFQLKNISNEDYPLMPWAKHCKNRSPYHLSRGLIFQNDKRLVQVSHYGDLTLIDGSYWVDINGKNIHINPFGKDDPNNSLFEISTQSHLLIPKNVGIGYLHITGIAFEHCANGFLRSSTGAVNAKGGHHWIIENNTIENINSSGLEFGYVAFEKGDLSPQNIPRTDSNQGGMIVKNNTISACGTAGIRSYMVNNAIVENNTIFNCGWQDAENYWEVAGIKMLRCNHTLVKGNHIYDMQGGNGIWLDWDNHYSRVTGNIIHDIQTVQGAIFIEASHVANLVDNNFIWNIDGNGVYLNDSDSTIVAHNLIGSVNGPVVSGVALTGRTQNGRLLTCENNTIVNNIFVDAVNPVHLESKKNTVNNNCFITTKHINSNFPVTQAYLQKGNNIIEIDGQLKYDSQINYLTMELQSELLKVPTLLYVDTDFFEIERRDKWTFPGPFETIKPNFKTVLK